VKRLRGFLAVPHQGKFQSDHEDGHTLLQKVALRLDSRESWDSLIKLFLAGNTSALYEVFFFWPGILPALGKFHFLAGNILLP
jgi:hypothetical protein